jgi:hypothetical protein
MSDFNEPQGDGRMPPPGPDQGWQGGGPVPPPALPPQQQGQSEAEHERTRVRVAVTIAALVATLGAIIFGFAITSGHGSKPTSSTAGANPNAVVDPPSASPSMGLSVPPAPSPLSSASAEASALAAQKAFAPPTAIPSDVVPYSGSAPLNAVSLPPFLTVTMPGISAKDQASQTLADQFTLFLKSWVEAWATGTTADARYRAWCVDQCRTMLDSTVTLWKNANILPAGTLRFFAMAGGTVNGGLSGLAGVCLDDSALKAFRGGATYTNPYPQGSTLYVFGLVYDKAVGHWVVTTGYSHAGDSYCAASSTTG